MAIFVLGTSPTDERLIVKNGGEVAGGTVGRSFGGGLKVGAFPAFGRGYFGVEGETFGHGGRLRAPSSATGEAAGSLVIYNLMANVLLRYPGSVVQPYIGVGVGESFGFLDADSVRAGTKRVDGKSGTFSLAYQVLGGLRARLTDQLFVFGEYKYFTTKYNWEEALVGSKDVELRFHTHIIAAGFGFSF